VLLVGHVGAQTLELVASVLQLDFDRIESLLGLLSLVEQAVGAALDLLDARVGAGIARRRENHHAGDESRANGDGAADH
jgi:hypothetical protein